MVPGELHSHAVQAERHLEALATGLAKVGADEAVIDGVAALADKVRQVVAVLGKGQELTGDDEAVETQQPERQTIATATDALHRDAQAAAAQRAGGY
jgi:hypothetical protein